MPSTSACQPRPVMWAPWRFYVSLPTHLPTSQTPRSMRTGFLAFGLMAKVCMHIVSLFLLKKRHKHAFWCLFKWMPIVRSWLFLGTQRTEVWCFWLEPSRMLTSVKSEPDHVCICILSLSLSLSDLLTFYVSKCGDKVCPASIKPNKPHWQIFAK